eukprot:1238363-Prymnesium_polylepis.1
MHANEVHARRTALDHKQERVSCIRPWANCDVFVADEPYLRAQNGVWWDSLQHEGSVSERSALR